MPMGAPAPAPDRSSRTIVAIVAAAVFVLAGGAALALFLTRDTGPHYPKEWDARVTDIAKFDETERGLKYKHPVDIEFMSEDDFKAAVTDSDGPTDDERTQIDQYTKAFRALGLISGDIDLFQQTQDLQSGGTLAYYDPKTKKIRVRGTEMTPALRVTLAHEMTHVLQDQYFDLTRLEKSKDSGERSAFRAVVEGDARGVEYAYVDQLSDADKASYEADNKQGSEDAGYDKEAQVLVANFTSPYIIGPPFVAALKAKGGNPAIDEAIKNPPTSEAALLDIFDYFDKTVPATVDPPTLGDDEKQIDGDPIGATTWYLMLVRRLPASDAVKAIDGWGGDSAVTYSEADGTVCVRGRYQGKTPADTDTMADLLDRWSSQSPEGASSISRGDGYVELKACDPGTDATLPGTDQSLSAIELLGVRLQVVQAGFEEGAAAPFIECISNGVLGQLTLDDISSTDQSAASQKFTTALQASAAACPR